MREAKTKGKLFLNKCGLEFSQKVTDIISVSRAASTWTVYSRWVSSWQYWMHKKGMSARQGSGVEVANYLASISSGKSVSQAASALSLFFNLHNVVPNPVAQKVVSLVCASARRLSAPTLRKKALGKEQIRALLTFLGKKRCFVSNRLSCMVLLCWGGCLRIEECLNLNTNDVTETEEDIVLHIKGAKTDKDREGQHTYIQKTGNSFCVAMHLRKYLRAAHLDRATKGPLFRSCYVDQTDEITKVTNKRMSYTTANEQLHTSFTKIGLIGTSYSWHSLRAGAASEALSLGASREAVKLHGRWASDEGIRPYIERNRQQRQEVSNLLRL